jgi:hypothetical protein
MSHQLPLKKIKNPDIRSYFHGTPEVANISCSAVAAKTPDNVLLPITGCQLQG